MAASNNNNKDGNKSDEDELKRIVRDSTKTSRLAVKVGKYLDHNPTYIVYATIITLITTAIVSVVIYNEYFCLGFLAFSVLQCSRPLLERLFGIDLSGEGGLKNKKSLVEQFESKEDQAMLLNAPPPSPRAVSYGPDHARSV